MQTTEHRPAGRGAPSARVPPTLSSSLSWHHPYFALAAFVAFIVCGSLFLNSLLVDSYVRSVAEDAEWAQHRQASFELGRLAARMNAPGNDVFESGDVSAGLERLQAARVAFDRRLDKARRDVRAQVDSEQAGPLLTDLDAVERHATAVSEGAERVFSHIRNGQADLAGRSMAAMDEEFVSVLAAVARFDRGVKAIQKELFEAAMDRAATFRRFEHGIAGLVVLMVAGFVVYGQTLRRRVQNHEEKKEEDARALRASEARLRSILDSTVDGIVTIDAAGVIESANHALSNTFGYEPHDLIGQNVAMLTPEPFRSEHDGYLARYLETGQRQVIGFGREVVATRKDGTLFPIELSVSEVDLGDRVVFTGVLRDISARKRAEEELLRLQRHHAQILNSAGEGIYGLDLEGNTTFANPAAARMLGWDVEDLVGQSLHPMIHHTRADGSPYPVEACPIHAALRDGTVHRAQSEVFWRKDGPGFPVEYVSTPIREGDRLVGAVVAFRDVSEKQRMEGQLRQAQKLESIGQLAAGIAHEINTPIQFVGASLQFLQDSFDDLNELTKSYAQLYHAARGGEVSDDILAEVATAEADADLEYLNNEIPSAIQQGREGVARVRKIVMAMTEFSHPGSTAKETIDLNQAIESTAAVSRNEWKDAADLVTELDPDLPPVTCLAAEINQVILNIIVNAAHAIHDALEDASAEKGAITIRTRRVDDEVVIEIRDTGGGIPEEVRDRIFDPFFTTKDVGKGTGQGLAIARSVIVEKHGGSLDFETELGKGTTFRIRLPIESQEGTSADLG